MKFYFYFDLDIMWGIFMAKPINIHDMPLCVKYVQTLSSYIILLPIILFFEPWLFYVQSLSPGLLLAIKNPYVV